MILVIDNYDSFVHNLARYLRELGWATRVVRNDEVSLDQIAELNPSHLVLSPGPRTPDQAGLSVEVVRRFGPTVPILGVCLGHQCIGQAFGGRVVRAPKPMHGKLSQIHHQGSGVFTGIPSPFTATRYHSLTVDRDSLPGCLEATAHSDDGVIQGLAHRSLPIHGVQFHPESIASEHGHKLLRNFIDLATNTKEH